MLVGQKCVDKDGVALTINERDSIGYPSESFLAGRDALRGARTLLGQKFPFQLRHAFSFREMRSYREARSREMGTEPVDGCSGGYLELVQIGIEVPALDHHEPLGLESTLVRLEG